MRAVMPLLHGLVQRHPLLRLDVRLTDTKVDLVRDGVDLAIRIGRMDDSSLVAKRVDQQALVLCASSAYLRARGTPRRLEELASHDAVVFRLPTSGRDRPWQFRQRGAAVDFSPIPHTRVNETEGLREAVKLGLGICQLPDLLVDRSWHAVNWWNCYPVAALTACRSTWSIPRAACCRRVFGWRSTRLSRCDSEPPAPSSGPAPMAGACQPRAHWRMRPASRPTFPRAGSVSAATRALPERRFGENKVCRSNDRNGSCSRCSSTRLGLQQTV